MRQLRQRRPPLPHSVESSCSIRFLLQPCHDTRSPITNHRFRLFRRPQADIQRALIHPIPQSHSFRFRSKGKWAGVGIQSSRTLTDPPELLPHYIHFSAVIRHGPFSDDFISLCGRVAPMCFWQSYGGLAGPQSPSGNVNWGFSVVSSRPAWWRRRPGNACLRPWTTKPDVTKHSWVYM